MSTADRVDAEDSTDALKGTRSVCHTDRCDDITSGRVNCYRVNIIIPLSCRAIAIVCNPVYYAPKCVTVISRIKYQPIIENRVGVLK